MCGQDCGGRRIVQDVETDHSGATGLSTAMIRALPGRQERDSYENGRKRGPSLEQRLSAHAMTAACHDRVDTFDSALMGHSLALQRLNEIKLSNGAQSWQAHCVFTVERYCRRW